MSRLDSKPVDDLQLKRIRDLNVAARHLEYSINELCPKAEKEKSLYNGLKKWLCGQIKQSRLRCSNE